MRTIDDIKESIAADFMQNESAAASFDFPVGANFTTYFSKVSIVSILFYVVACAVWVLENLLDLHKQEVNTRIEEILPHRPKWYRDKVLAFMKDMPLISDTDRYDTDGMSEDEIAAARFVKHAVAMENRDASILTIKVAGEAGGKRCRLDDDTESQLAAYIGEIKDAGVRINLVNIAPDIFNCEIDIYYNPMLLPENIEQSCRDAIQKYIENLPFNGEYTNMELVDTLQKVEGVKIPEFKSATTAANGESTLSAIDARCVPAAGYFVPNNIVLNMRAYE